MAFLEDLAELVGGEIFGDPRLEVSAVNDLDLAAEGEIAFLSSAKLSDKLAHCAASALILPLSLKAIDPRPAILVAKPMLAVALIQKHLLPSVFSPQGVHPSAVIAESCSLPKETNIGACAVLAEGVQLGERVTIGAGVVLGEGVVVGDDSFIHPNVTVYPKSIIGRRVIVHSGTVIGSDGFGYANDEQGRHHKIFHQGIVRVEDDVEIGANVCIDRATFGETIVGAGTKVDNLVQIGHNVKIGKSCVVVSQTGISGSTSLGNGVVLGGQVGLAGHLQVGDRAMVASKSGVHGNIEPGVVVSGIPAIEHKKWLKAATITAKLPEMQKELRELRRAIEQLQKKG